MTQQNYALAVAQLIKAAEELVESIGNDPLSYRSGVKRGNLIGALKAVAAVPRPEPVGFSPIHGKLYTEQPAPAEPVNARLLTMLKENHEWHIQYDEHDGYAESDLCEKNMEAIAAAEQQQALSDLSAVQHEIQPGYVQLPELSDEQLIEIGENLTAESCWDDPFEYARAVIAADRELRGVK